MRWVVRVAVTTGVGAYILGHVDRASLVRTVADVRPGLVAVALAIYLLGQAVSACKWSLIGRAVGFDAGVLQYVRFYFIGMFFNLFGPSTLGGDLARGLALGAGGRRAVAINSVVFDRASGLTLLMALGAVALLVFPTHGLPRPLVVSMMVAGIVLLAGWWMCPRLVRLLPPGHRIRQHVERDLAPFWRDRGLLGRVAATSVVFHLSQVVVQWVLARAAGAVVPFGYCLLYHPLISVISALPISIGGFGVREGGYLYFLGRIGVDRSVAVTIGLLWFTLTLLGGLVGGVVFALAGTRLELIPPPVESPPA